MMPLSPQTRPPRSRTAAARPRRRASLRPAMLAVVLAAPLLMALGCAQRALTTDHAIAMAQLQYPEQAERGEDLDVLVTRRGRQIHIVNREGRSFAGMQLWLNEQYVDELSSLPPGDHRWIMLTSFINRYQEPFPTAGLLRPDRARAVLSAELYDPDQNVRYPLVVNPEHD